MSRLFFYDHLKSVISRLPQNYKTRYLENQEISKGVQASRKCGFTVDQKSGNKFPTAYYDGPVHVIYPPESNRCLWGGEGIVQGYGQKNMFSPKYAKTWAPALMEQAFYSEILDRWMIIIVSESALRQIELSGGLDHYILSTPESKLKSRVGMFLKRDMLITLAKASVASQKQWLVKKYSSHILPLEEAEWIGLTLEEAVKKQLKLEYEASRKQALPRKFQFASQLVDQVSTNGQPNS